MGLMAALMLKDLNPAAAAAGAVCAETPMGDGARRLYERLLETDGGLDFSAVIRLYGVSGG